MRIEFQKRTWFTKPPPALRTAVADRARQARAGGGVHPREPAVAGSARARPASCARFQSVGHLDLRTPRELRTDVAADGRCPARRKQSVFITSDENLKCAFT